MTAVCGHFLVNPSWWAALGWFPSGHGMRWVADGITDQYDIRMQLEAKTIAPKMLVWAERRLVF